MEKLVNSVDSKSTALRLAGSSPAIGTTIYFFMFISISQTPKNELFKYFYVCLCLFIFMYI